MQIRLGEERKIDSVHLDEWKNETMLKVMTRIQELKTKPTKSV